MNKAESGKLKAESRNKKGQNVPRPAVDGDVHAPGRRHSDDWWWVDMLST